MSIFTTFSKILGLGGPQIGRELLAEKKVLTGGTPPPDPPGIGSPPLRKLLTSIPPYFQVVGLFLLNVGVPINMLPRQTQTNQRAL